MSKFSKNVWRDQVIIEISNNMYTFGIIKYWIQSYINMLSKHGNIDISQERMKFVNKHSNSNKES